ncbi:MAG: MATE family efflux transporter [Clostridia bacterium]|nr:MATE family efflux transporter [Clostridia bacterium]
MKELNFDGELTLRKMLGMVIRLSIPTILAELTTVLMEYIDAAMVGSLGANSTAAIGLVSTTTWLIGGLSLAASTGFSVQVAQLVGAKRDGDVRNVVRQGMMFVVLFGIALMMIAVAISGSLPGWLGGAEEIRGDAAVYFRIYALFLPVMQLRYISGAMLQCSGDMKTPSELNILLCVLDVIFNFFLIFPTRQIDIFGSAVTVPGAGLGVAGAALGTVFAELAVTGSMLYALCVRSPQLAFRYGGRWRFERSCMRTAARIAIPSAFEHSIMCGAYLVATIIVAPLGTVSIAANSLAITAESLCYMPGYGIGAAATTLVGQSIGAGRRDAAARFARASVLLGIGIMAFMGVIMYITAPAMFRVLTTSEEVRRLGVSVLRIEAFAEPLYAASIVCAGAMRGAGDTLVPGVLSLISMWGFRICPAIALVRIFGLRGFWMAMCGELCLRGVLFLIRLLRGRWLKREII